MRESQETPPSLARVGATMLASPATAANELNRLLRSMDLIPEPGIGDLITVMQVLGDLSIVVMAGGRGATFNCQDGRYNKPKVYEVSVHVFLKESSFGLCIYSKGFNKRLREFRLADAEVPVGRATYEISEPLSVRAGRWWRYLTFGAFRGGTA